MSTEDVGLSALTEQATKAADARIAILKAEDALCKIRGFLPASVGFPLQSAHGKLQVALAAVDAWESDLLLKSFKANERKLRPRRNTKGR